MSILLSERLCNSTWLSVGFLSTELNKEGSHSFFCWLNTKSLQSVNSFVFPCWKLETCNFYHVGDLFLLVLEVGDGKNTFHSSEQCVIRLKVGSIILFLDAILMIVCWWRTQSFGLQPAVSRAMKVREALREQGSKLKGFWQLVGSCCEVIRVSYR